MKLFLDSQQAAELLGCTKRHFHKKYVESGLLTPIRFDRAGAPAGRGSVRRHFFLRAAVERLKG